MIEWPRSFQFKTGRKDCSPDPNEARPFLTSRSEIHPNAQGNGVQTIDFYKENFGLTAREGIALTGGTLKQNMLCTLIISLKLNRCSFFGF